jgi:VanZ family protein
MKRPLQGPDWRRILWPIALALLVVACSSRQLPQWAEPVFSSDKLVHALVFGLLATLVARLASVQRTRPLGIYAAIVIVSVFGISDELHQHFTPGRSMDIWDWTADTVGAALATALYAEWQAYRRLLETPVLRLFRKPRVEIGETPCVIPADGLSVGPETPCRTPRPGRAA